MGADPKRLFAYSSEALEEMVRLRDRKPRPLAKLYGKKGPTPEQKAEWDASTKAWNAAYRHAAKWQKKLLADENRAFHISHAAAEAGDEKNHAPGVQRGPYFPDRRPLPRGAYDEAREEALRTIARESTRLQSGRGGDKRVLREAFERAQRLGVSGYELTRAEHGVYPTAPSSGTVLARLPREGETPRKPRRKLTKIAAAKRGTVVRRDQRFRARLEAGRVAMKRAVARAKPEIDRVIGAVVTEWKRKVREPSSSPNPKSYPRLPAGRNHQHGPGKTPCPKCGV